MSSNINFTKEEYFHVARSFDRIKQSYKKLKPEEWERGDKAIIKQINAKFRLEVSEETVDYSVFLKRQQVRVIEEYCIKTLKRLNEVIIPEYHKRGGKEDYIEQANKLIQKIEGIKVKLEAVL